MSLFGKLRSVLQKTANKITDKVSDVLYKTHPSDQDLELLEEALLSIDVGTSHTQKVISFIKSKRFDPDYTNHDLKSYLSAFIEQELVGAEQKIAIDKTPTVVLMCGVNGSGKTTIIGKLANYYIQDGFKVAIAACDTFRAAAVEQLKIWAERAGAKFISGAESQDPASVAYQALEYSKNNSYDLLLIDTAGRLQNHYNLMQELSKICKVLKKVDESAPHYSLLVLDATIGQNAISQVEQFKLMADLNGLILTKLDGTAKGGILLPIFDKFKLPIYFVGVGEKIEDIKEFSAKEFSGALLQN